MISHSFESFIIQCCKAPEWDLRKFLKKKLIEAGFSIKEDDYLSDRAVANKWKYSKPNPKYGKVHNMLAVRGQPRVCVVAHTDVCRDHGVQQPPLVFPIIKERNGRKIIQDAECRHQTGGDDRLGVAINAWIALNTGYDMALLFTTDEEIGLVSADYVKFPELNTYDILVQVDRGNHSNQLVSRIGSTRLHSKRTGARLLRIAAQMNMPRDEVHGLPTDVASIVRNGIAKEACNMTCGYHNSHGSSKDEYIDIEEARDTMYYVSRIIKYYDLREDSSESAPDEDEVSPVKEDGEIFHKSLIKTCPIDMTEEDWLEMNNQIQSRKSPEERQKYIEDITAAWDKLEEASEISEEERMVFMEWMMEDGLTESEPEVE